MAVRAFPFAGQEAGEADYYRRWYRIVNGVYHGLNIAFGQSFSGLGFSLSTGEMGVGGATLVVEDQPYVGQSAVNNGSLPVRDMLVARRTLLPNGDSTAGLFIKRGPAGTVPSDPLLTQQPAGVWEEPLWSWTVPASGGTTVTSVSDRRMFIGSGSGGGGGGGPVPTAQPRMHGRRRSPNADVQHGSWTVFTTENLWAGTDPFGVRIGGSKLRFPVGGWWSVGATARFNNNGVGNRGIQLVPQGVLDLGEGSGVPVHLGMVPAVTGGTDTTVHGELMRPYSVGDEVWVEVYHNAEDASGAAVDLRMVQFHVWARYEGPL